MHILNIPIDCLVEIINNIFDNRDVVNLLSTCKKLYEMDLSTYSLFPDFCFGTITKIFISVEEYSIMVTNGKYGISACSQGSTDIKSSPAKIKGLVFKQNLVECINSFKSRGSIILFEQMMLNDEKSWKNSTSNKLYVTVDWNDGKIKAITYKQEKKELLWECGKISGDQISGNQSFIRDSYFHHSYCLYLHKSIVDNPIGNILIKALILLERPKSSPKF